MNKYLLIMLGDRDGERLTIYCPTLSAARRHAPHKERRWLIPTAHLLFCELCVPALAAAALKLPLTPVLGQPCVG